MAEPAQPVIEFSSLLDGTIGAAHQAGAQLRAAQDVIEAGTIEWKSASVDLVSSADRDAEFLLRRALLALLPQAGFIGEESPFPDLADNSLFWCVDPLDGTSNFLCGLPL